MNSNQPPIFRKSMHGYNKEDVNAYISNMSRIFFEKEKEYQTNLSSCYAKIQEDGKVIQDLENKLSVAVNDVDVALQKDLQDTQKQLQNTEAELEKLKDAYMAQQKAMVAGVTDDPMSYIRNIAVYDTQNNVLDEEISMKAGKIMVAAQNAAEAIVQKAREEAEAIINGANDRKERIFHNITATADTVMSDISTYMKTAVDKCFQEIYGGAESVSASRFQNAEEKRNGQTNGQTK